MKKYLLFLFRKSLDNMENIKKRKKKTMIHLIHIGNE